MSKEFRWDLAKQGDAAEVERIVEKYYKVAYKIAHWWARSGKIEESEALGLANIAIMKCITKGTYDETRGVKFTSYLCSAVHNEIRMFLRKERRLQDKISFSLDQPIRVRSGSQEIEDITYADTITDPALVGDFLDDVCALEDALDILHYASVHMTNLEVECIDLHLQGLTAKQIGAELGFSQSHIRNILISAHTKLREFASLLHL